MKYDIDKLKRKLLIKYPLFGTVLTKVEFKETEEIKIAETDGKTIFYNPTYLQQKTIEEQLFVLAHEICHIALNHIERAEGKNINLWNYVTDAVINQFLKKDNLSLVPYAIDVEYAINYDCEELYEKLFQEGKDYSSLKKGHTTHKLWEEERKKSKLIGKESDEGKESQETKFFEENRLEKKNQLENLKKELQQEQIPLKTENTIVLEEIGISKDLINWRIYLRETMNKEMDWSYQNATIENGIVTPNLKEIPIPETEIVLDTSASITRETLITFLRECKNILKYTKLKVGCFDKKFYGFHEIRTAEDIENMSIEGGGGTDFDVAVNAFTRRVENKVIFTDGKAMMPKETLNILWIVLDGEKITPKGGKVIYITSNELNNINTKQKEKIKTK